jgi:hypothetical protein
MKLIATSAEESITAVRGLSEGRIQRRLRTVPHKDFTAPVARAECAWEDRAPVRMVNTKSSSRHRAADDLENYRATKPGKFTTPDYALFAGIAITTASTRMNDYARKGVVERAGKAGRNIIWRFA